MRLLSTLVLLIHAFTMSSPTYAGDCRVPSNPCPSARKPAELLFEATGSTRGPYGEMWKVKLDKDNSMTVEASWVINPMGSLKGTFFLDQADIARISTAAESAKFFSLPKEIVPSHSMPIHASDLRILLTSNGKTHFVSLYAPAEVADQTKVARFMAVWSAIFSKLPVRPSLQ